MKFVFDIFIVNRAGKQVVEEQAELIKYSKIKSLGTILFEYVIIIFFLLRSSTYILWLHLV